MVKNFFLLVILCLFSGCASREQVRQQVREETASMKTEMEEWSRAAEQKQYTDLVERLEAAEARLRTLREVEVRLMALEGLMRKKAETLGTLEESIGLGGGERIAVKEGLVQMEGRLSILEEELGNLSTTLGEFRKEGGEPLDLRTEMDGLTSKMKELEKLSGVAAVEASDREIKNLKARVEELRSYLDLQMSALLKSVLDLKNFVIDKTTSMEAEMKGKLQLMEKGQKEAEKEGKELQTTQPQQSL